MASKTLFKGIKRVLSSSENYKATSNNDYLYFVRESTSATEGDIWFQGVHYGHFGEHDLDAINKALEGFLTGQEESGYTTVKEYIDNIVAGFDSSESGTTDHVSVQVDIKDGMLTGVTVDTWDIASESAVTKEMTTIEDAVGLDADGSKKENEGKYISGKTTVEAEIKSLNDAIEAMDVDPITETGKAIIAVSEDDGKISATAGTIDAQYVDVADSDNLLDATNVEDAFKELAEKANAITVSSNDKTVTVTTSATGTDLSVNIDGKTIVKSDVGVLKADLTIARLEESELETNVREAYKLIYSTDEDKTAIGETIKIYKDSSLVKFYLGTVNDKLTNADEGTKESPDSAITYGASGDSEALVYVVQLANGNYQLTAVDVETFLQEAEFKDGLRVVNHEVSVKVDSSSEQVIVGPASSDTVDVITVSSDGVKIANIQKAIEYAVKDLAENIDATVEDESDDKHVKVEIVQEDTKLKSVTVTTDDIASAKELDDVESSLGFDNTTYSNTGEYIGNGETNTVTSDIKALDTALKGLADEVSDLDYSGVTNEDTKVITDVTQTDGFVSAQTTKVDDLKITGITTSDTKVAANDTLSTIAGKLQGQIDAMDLEEVFVSGAAIVKVSETDGKVNAITGNVDTDHVVLSEAIDGDNVSAATQESTTSVLKKIVDAIDSLDSSAYTGVTSSASTINITETENGQNIEVNVKELTTADVENGETEIRYGEDGALYGVMYWIDDEDNTEEKAQPTPDTTTE